MGMLVCAYVFPYSSFLRQTQPYRYLVSFALFAVIPAALGVGELAARWTEANRAGRVLSACVLAALLPSLTAYLLDLAACRPAQGMDTVARQVVEWMGAHGSREGRVLCQDEMIGSMLPYYSRQQIIGGAGSKHSLLRYGLTSVEAGELFGRKIAEVSAADFARY